MQTMIAQIRKRDGAIVPFEPGKIIEAIFKSLKAVNSGDRTLAAQLAEKAAKLLEERKGSAIPGVEEVQDSVEEVLMAQGFSSVARAYIIYREQRAR